MASKKYLNINPNILMEYEYDSTTISENYSIWSDLSKGTRNFTSNSTNLNNINYNLCVIDSVQRKYSKIDPSKFNFLKIQNYFTGLVSYDKVTIYFPSNYNFEAGNGVSYFGFILKIFAYDYNNKKPYYLSNFYYDKTQAITNEGDSTVIYADSLMNLGTPFVYNQKEWGKYLTYYVPSINAVSNQRDIDQYQNVITPDSINDNLAPKIGLDPKSLINFEFSFITSKQIVFNIPYYYSGDIFKMVIPNQPEYQTLGVSIEESTQGDFFEIYGTYKNSNENLDNFVAEQESKGRKINIEYTVTLFEENLQSGFPITFLVTENFAQKIEYRPIIKYSNTTAAIDVEMKVLDLVDSSSFSRFASIGLTKNILKYGKTLSKLEISNISKPKIYNYRYDKNYDFKTNSNKTDVSIMKVQFPVLIDNYKILALNYNPSTETDYMSMGLLNIIISPFDNIIKFQIAKQDTATSNIVPYDLSQILLNAKLNLVFKSDNKNVEKEIYYQTDENNFSMGIVVFKISQEDIPLLKQINKEKSDNFYIVLNSKNTKTLLYSGKFKIFENIKFLNTQKTTITSGSTTPSVMDTNIVNISNPTNTSTTNSNSSITNNSTNNLNNNSTSNGGMNDVIPPQFDANGIPIIEPSARGQLDYYKNVILWVKAGLTPTQIALVDSNIKALELTINYTYRTPINSGPIVVIIERVPIEVIEKLKAVPNIDNVKTLDLDFGWKKSTTSQLITDSIGSVIEIKPSTNTQTDTYTPSYTPKPKPPEDTSNLL